MTPRTLFVWMAMTAQSFIALGDRIPETADEKRMIAQVEDLIARDQTGERLDFLALDNEARGRLISDVKLSMTFFSKFE